MGESKAKYQFGAINLFHAEAIGEPGHRVFRLVVESGAATAYLWMEKEQLSQLGIYIQEICDSLLGQIQDDSEDVPDPEWMGGVTKVEFEIGKLALGHDTASNAFLILAHDREEGEEGQATLSFWATLTQAKELADEALKVCGAGRPRCFLCGRPIDPEGHMCPRSNGHAKLES